MAKRTGCAPYLRPGTVQYDQILESEAMGLVETLDEPITKITKKSKEKGRKVKARTATVSARPRQPKK